MQPFIINAPVGASDLFYMLRLFPIHSYPPFRVNRAHNGQDQMHLIHIAGHTISQVSCASIFSLSSLRYIHRSVFSSSSCSSSA